MDKSASSCAPNSNEEAALVSGDTLGRAFGLISRIDCHAAGEHGMGLY
jgi:hypothetical protein